MEIRQLVNLTVVPVLLATTLARAEAPAAGAAPRDPTASTSETATTPTVPAVVPPPTSSSLNKFQVSVYGFAKLDAIADSTQRVNEAPGNQLIGQSYPGEPGDPDHNGRTMLTARDSRIGFILAAPEWEGMRASAQIEGDFGGGPAGGNVAQAYGPAIAAPADGSTAIYSTGRYPPYSNNYGNEAAYTTTGTFRLRLAYLQMKTRYVDVLAGQNWSLLGWGVNPFFSNSLIIGGPVGPIFSRNPQVRFSKVMETDAINIEIAAGAFRGQRDAQIPDIQAGIKVSLNGWRGIHQIFYGRPNYDALQIGVSGVYRQFKLREWGEVSNSYVKLAGWGAAFDAFIPIIRGSREDMSNALCLTGEYNTGAGISDLYQGLTGGDDRFVPVAEAIGMTPAIYYQQNIDNGIVGHKSFDATIDPAGHGQFIPIRWTGIVAGLQYHLPVYAGKLFWVSALYGQITSSNIGTIDLPPEAVFNKSIYFDGTLWVGLGPAVVLGFMYQTMQNTYLEGAKSVRNQRGQGAFIFFF